MQLLTSLTNFDIFFNNLLLLLATTILTFFFTFFLLPFFGAIVTYIENGQHSQVLQCLMVLRLPTAVQARPSC